MDIGTVELCEEDVLKFAMHFLFGLPYDKAPDDIMVFTVYEGRNVTRIIIKNKHIFKARKTILAKSKSIKKLEDFSKYWQNHIKMLEEG